MNHRRDVQVPLLLSLAAWGAIVVINGCSVVVIVRALA